MHFINSIKYFMHAPLDASHTNIEYFAHQETISNMLQRINFLLCIFIDIGILSCYIFYHLFIAIT